jgi:hypothetical protein
LIGTAFVEYRDRRKNGGKIQLGAESLPVPEVICMMHTIPQAPEYVRKWAEYPQIFQNLSNPSKHTARNFTWLPAWIPYILYFGLPNIFA